MTKKITALLLIISLLIICTGCAGGPDVPDTSMDDSGFTEDSMTPVEGLTGTFTMDTSSQYNNSICRVKQMDEALMLFELDVMEGSESEDRASEYVMSGVMLLNEQGTEGIYETDPDAAYPVVLQFDFDEDRTGFTVTTEGDCGFDPNGHYTFIEEEVEVSEGLAIELIEQLPTAATSLSGNLGGYTIDYPDSLVSGWFYPVDAVLDDSGKTLASFLVSKDLTCVIRVDEDIEPVLIWGSTESMMKATIMPDYSELDGLELPEGFLETDYAREQPVVSMEMDNGAVLMIGESSTVTPLLPWELPYTLELTSSDPAVVHVDGNVMTGEAAGTATVQATLTVFDSTATYEIPMEIFMDNGSSDNTTEDASVDSVVDDTVIDDASIEDDFQEDNSLVEDAVG